jgi:site-specific DNA-methyltransferase (adenine-specific)
MMQAKSLSEPITQQGNKKLNEKRIHPTQKPVLLYKSIFSKFANIGDLILDTHVGSGSSLIACEDFDLEYVGSEIDSFFYYQSLQRLEAHLSQGKLFQRVGGDVIRLEQPSMFA